jgi:hypothetical protein
MSWKITWKRALLALAAVVVAAVGVVTYLIGGPRNLIGMLRYDQRQEGNLKVGDPAPDARLTALDGVTRVSLLAGSDASRPTVVIFGSFT